MRPAFDLSLYLVLDPELCEPLGMAETAAAAAAGGATLVQLRDKTGDTARRIAAGRAVKAALAGTGVPLIVDDDAEAALAIGAEGLHVGQDDLPPERARALIGPDAILGLSVETPALAAAADPAIVDYVGAGPVFATATKPGHKPPVGMAGLARIARATRLPAVAIGGLKATHAAEAIAAGAGGMAVVSAICGTPDPEAAARRLARAIRAAKIGGKIPDRRG